MGLHIPPPLFIYSGLKAEEELHRFSCFTDFIFGIESIEINSSL